MVKRGFLVNLIICIVRVVLFCWHPVFRVVGRENFDGSGRLMICANHSGMADPIWIVFALRSKYVPRIMAKQEVMDVPVLGWFLKQFGVFGVDREGTDIQAIKTGLRCLNDEQQLLVFPEGTRVKAGQRVEPKRGAVTLAARTDAPILPVYLSADRRPFSPITCVIGKPYKLQFEGRRASDEELNRFSDELMKTIYALGEEV